jgi:hypothetical protein
MDVASLLPFLNSKMLDVDVTRKRNGTTDVDHFDGGFIVFKKGGGSILRETKKLRNDTERRDFAILAASTAARNSALVLEAAVMDCVRHQQAMTPAARRKL